MGQAVMISMLTWMVAPLPFIFSFPHFFFCFPFFRGDFECEYGKTYNSFDWGRMGKYGHSFP